MSPPIPIPILTSNIDDAFSLASVLPCHGQEPKQIWESIFLEDCEVFAAKG